MFIIVEFKNKTEICPSLQIKEGHVCIPDLSAENLWLPRGCFLILAYGASWNSSNLQNYFCGRALWIRPCWVAVLDCGMGGEKISNYPRAELLCQLVWWSWHPPLVRSVGSGRYPEVTKEKALLAYAEKDLRFTNTYNHPITYSRYYQRPSLGGIQVHSFTSPTTHFSKPSVSFSEVTIAVSSNFSKVLNEHNFV